MSSVSFPWKLWGKTRNKPGSMTVIMAAMPWATSSTGVGRRAKRETALDSYNDFDATLTGDINHTSALFLIWHSGVLIFCVNLLKLYLVRCDEWFKRLQLKPGKWPLKTDHTAWSKGSTLLWSPPNTWGGVLPYMDYIGMCRCKGYGFQAVYSRVYKSERLCLG